MTLEDPRARWIARVRRLCREIAASEEVRRDFLQRRGRALLGAAMIFSGALSRPKIRRIAQQSNLRHHLHLAELEEGRVDDLVVDGEHHLADAIADGGGAILAAFHFGAFRRIAPLFVLRGHRVALLATRGATDHLVRDVPAAYAGGSDVLASAIASRYLPIDSTSPAAMWRLRGALAEGRLVVFYPDGNTGVEGKAPDASCHPITFLGRSMHVHAGLGWLASAVDRPVIPVVSRESTGRTTTLELGEPIRRARSETRAAYRARVLETIFARLESEVLRAPERWEQWTFVWQWAERGAALALPLTDEIDLASLRRHRLRLVDPHVWTAEIENTGHVFDVRAWSSLGTSPALVALVVAAERGETLGAWLDALPSGVPAATMVATMRALGAIDVEEPT